MCLGKRGKQEPSHELLLSLECFWWPGCGARYWFTASCHILTLAHWLCHSVTYSRNSCVLSVSSVTCKTFSLIKTMLQVSGFQIKNTTKKSWNSLQKQLLLEAHILLCLLHPLTSPYHQQIPGVHEWGKTWKFRFEATAVNECWAQPRKLSEHLKY